MQQKHSCDVSVCCCSVSSDAPPLAQQCHRAGRSETSSAHTHRADAELTASLFAGMSGGKRGRQI